MNTPISSALRDTRTETPDHLWQRVLAFTGVRVARRPVCLEHRPPFDWFSDLWFNRPAQALVLGPRGGGKSFLSAVLTHLGSRFQPGLGTCILGGSRAQAMQAYEALATAVVDGRGHGGSDAAALARFGKAEARYRNSSRVAILTASRTAVRGPHVPTLRLDEVDEIPTDLREAAYGMAMARGGVPASVIMTSTWHRVGGPTADLISLGLAGAFPIYASCAFDVLDRCPESRSGPCVGGEAGYERCPDCPLKPWCHAERDRNGGAPLAKRADGHYAIHSLIQKARGLSRGVFEADYTCTGPRADGVWFKDFNPTRNVSPRRPTTRPWPPPSPSTAGCSPPPWPSRCGLPRGRPLVTVFLDYLAAGCTAEANARAILAALKDRHGLGRKVSADPAGGARNPVGPTVLAEYERAGLRNKLRWPTGPAADSLALVESLIPRRTARLPS
jgi:hypothetical protein